MKTYTEKLMTGKILDISRFNNKKFFDGLKAEGFSPLLYKIIHKEEGYFYMNDFQILLKNNSHIFEKIENDNLFTTFLINKEEDKNNLFEESRFNHISKNTYNKGWFLFIKRLIKEFNIDINEVKFSIYNFPDAFKTREEVIKMKDKKYMFESLNLLQKCILQSAPTTAIESLIKLGMDYKKPYKFYFPHNMFKTYKEIVREESTLFITLLLNEEYPINIKSKLIQLFLDKDFSLISDNKNLYNSDGTCKVSDFYSIFSSLSEKDRNILGEGIYSVIVKNKIKDKPIISQATNESTLFDFLCKNSQYFKSLFEKDKINSLLKITSTTKLQNKKRL